MVGAIFTAAIFRQLTVTPSGQSLKQPADIASMVLSIRASSTMFSQCPAFSGATSNLASIVPGSAGQPVFILLMMMTIAFVFCMVIDQVALMVVVIWIDPPIAEALSFDPIRFGLLMLVYVTIGGMTPPYLSMRKRLQAVICQSARA